MGCLATHDGCAAAPSRGDCLLQVRERKLADAAAAANANANRPADNSPARAALLGLSEALGRAEGRQRLELAARIRNFRALTGEPANEFARQIVAAMEPGGGDVKELAAEVATLTALCERLVGEDEVDRLVDL